MNKTELTLKASNRIIDLKEILIKLYGKDRYELIKNFEKYLMELDLCLNEQYPLTIDKILRFFGR